MTTITSSNKFALNGQDWLKGLVVAVITPVITIIIDSLNAGTLVFDWKHIAITALTAGLAYLVKNFLDPAKIVITDPSPKSIADVKKGNAVVNITNPH